jgi:2-aminoethylphosphonate dioxygenase
MNTIGTSFVSRQSTLAQVHEYHSQGFVTVRGLFATEQVAAAKAACETLWQGPAIRDHLRVEMRGHVASESVPDRLDPVLDLSPELSALAQDRQLTGLLTELLGEEVRLFRCKLIRKGPGTLGYSLHQDFPYWEWLGLPPDHLLTAYVAIDPADRQSGALELFPGLHGARLPAPPGEPRDADETRIDTTLSEVPDLRAGDVVVFHSLTPHRSGPNLAAGTRFALLPSYAVARHSDLYEHYYAWYLGRKSGTAR